MTKMTILALISITGSVLLIIGLVVSGVSGSITPGGYIFVGLGGTLDVFLDSMVRQYRPYTCICTKYGHHFYPLNAYYIVRIAFVECSFETLPQDVQWM